ncbi:MAG: SoxR reducing system RseC family protein [Actinomycetota bacterium]|nr:SoxR reducing system RseC family protein [Actinomycetota bacterium]
MMGAAKVDQDALKDRLPELYDYPSATRSREERGKVVEVYGDTARVMLRRSRYCEGCGSCCVVVDNDTMLAEAENRMGAVKGDRVMVNLPLEKSIKAAYILYGIPLIAFLAGFVLGALLGAAVSGSSLTMPLGLVFAFGLMALSYILLSRRYGSNSKASRSYRLVITRKLPDPESESVQET